MLLGKRRNDSCILWAEKRLSAQKVESVYRVQILTGFVSFTFVNALGKAMNPSLPSIEILLGTATTLREIKISLKKQALLVYLALDTFSVATAALLYDPNGLRDS